MCWAAMLWGRIFARMSCSLPAIHHGWQPRAVLFPIGADLRPLASLRLHNARASQIISGTGDVFMSFPSLLLAVHRALHCCPVGLNSSFVLAITESRFYLRTPRGKYGHP